MPENVSVFDDIVRYLWRCGLVRQSVERLAPELPRWERFLRSQGVDAIPPLPSRSRSARESRAHNLLALLIDQSSLVPDGAKQHHLRNLTRVRPYKS
jgi:hypothetical protein